MPTETRAKTFIEYAGAQVRRHRQRLRLTQEQFAERCGYVPRYIQRIETGKVDMPISTLVRLADVIGIPPVGLLRTAKLGTPKIGRPRAKPAIAR